MCRNSALYLSVTMLPKFGLVSRGIYVISNVHFLQMRKTKGCVHIYIYMGESNGKLPPRTCPGCSVPEPYRSHDWALVPANPASKAEY